MRIVPLLLAAAALTAPAAAQSSAASSASTQSALAKPTLTPKDIAKWEQLGAPRLSPDGSWISYTITRGNEENAVDYERRILQWFGYWLKGEAPAKWITDGQTWLERKAILDANK